MTWYTERASEAEYMYTFFINIPVGCKQTNMLHTKVLTVVTVLHVFCGEPFIGLHDRAVVSLAIPLWRVWLVRLDRAGGLWLLDVCTISGSRTSSCSVPCFFLQSVFSGCLAGSAGIVGGTGGGMVESICWAGGMSPVTSTLICRFRLLLWAFLIAFQFCRNCRSNSLTSRPSTIPVCVCVCVCVRGRGYEYPLQTTQWFSLSKS